MKMKAGRAALVMKSSALCFSFSLLVRRKKASASSIEGKRGIAAVFERVQKTVY